MLHLEFHQKQGPKLERSHFLRCGRATLELRNIRVICGSWKVPYTRRRLMPLGEERQRIYASVLLLLLLLLLPVPLLPYDLLNLESGF